MPQTLCCIGCGNMGSAILLGLAHSIRNNSLSLYGCNRSPEKMKRLETEGIASIPDIASATAMADILVLAVKPAQIPDALKQAAATLRKEVIVLSVAAGIGIKTIREILGNKGRIARCMPTTTALAGRGVFAFCFEKGNFPAEEQTRILELFSHLGYCIELAENKFTNFSALIGAGPAYVFAFMHGLSQAGITLGFTRDECRKLIVELFAGSAKLAETQPKSFSDLRDDVCSPAGLTIAGVNVLDRAGLSGLLVDAVLAATARGKEMES